MTNTFNPPDETAPPRAPGPTAVGGEPPEPGDDLSGDEPTDVIPDAPTALAVGVEDPNGLLTDYDRAEARALGQSVEDGYLTQLLAEKEDRRDQLMRSGLAMGRAAAGGPIDPDVEVFRPTRARARPATRESPPDIDGSPSAAAQLAQPKPAQPAPQGWLARFADRWYNRL